jgi:hypothetical protein
LSEKAAKEAKKEKMKTATRKKRLEIVTLVPIGIKKVVMLTPRVSRELRMLHGFFDQWRYSDKARRLLFRKAEKGYDEKDWQLKMALREKKVLKTTLEAAATSKRRKVEASPNSRFVNIRAIRRAKIEAGEIEAGSADEEGSEESKTPNSCIVVGSGEDNSDDEVAG